MGQSILKMVCLPQKGVYLLLNFSFSSEGDFEAFRAFVRTTGTAQIIVSYNEPNPAPGPLGEFTSNVLPCRLTCSPLWNLAF